MANEVVLNMGLRIKSGFLEYNSTPSSVQQDMDSATAKGPYPGARTIATTGTDELFAELDTPGLCWLHNLDTVNWVDYGIRSGTEFRVLGRVRPGKCALFEFSPDMMETHYTTGTGSTGDVNVFHMRANDAPVRLRIDCFENNLLF